MSFKNFILSKLFLKNLGFAIIIAVGGVMILMIWMNFYTRHGQARPVPDFVGLTMEQTVKLAKKSRLRYQIIDSIYTTSVPRGCIAEQNPKPGFKVKKWRNIVLTINAFHPEMVAMPNLVNLPLRQATALIESSGLEVGQRKYRPDISINVVIEQQYNGRKINEGDSIQKGSVVDLLLGKGLSNERTTIPYLIGMKLEPAKNKILVSSLNLGTFVYDKTIVNSNDSLNAFVYKQIPEYKDNATLQLGSMVYLWLTADPAKIKMDSTIVVSDTIPAIPTPDTQNN
jgi:eukaryotic-like serine/threonine-protein kinase